MVNILGYEISTKHLVIGILILLFIAYLYKTRMEYFDDGSAQGQCEIVLFYAPWCPHCKDMMPEWEKLAQKHSGSSVLKVRKVDSDASPDEAKEHKVDGYPTIILFKNGKKIVYQSGQRDAKSLEEFALTS